jgi:2-keto-4-pentenoate hydratase
MLDSTQRTTAADLLWAAERDLAPIDPLTETFPGIDAVDAYEIQLINIRRKIAAGARVRGHKVGLSSPVMQQMMGVDEPDYGHLLDSMVLRGGEVPIPAGGYCYPRIEVEIGYVLGSALPGADCTEEDVLAATEYIVPSLELIDSRITNWQIKLPDTIADNASSAGVILGEARRTPAELAEQGVDIANIDAVLYAGDPASSKDTEVARGNTSAVLGNPTWCVAWLARKVAGFGVKLEAGHLIIPGSCTRAIDARAGTAFRAEFAGLGTVTAEFN